MILGTLGESIARGEKKRETTSKAQAKEGKQQSFRRNQRDRSNKIVAPMNSLEKLQGGGSSLGNFVVSSQTSLQMWLQGDAVEP